MAELSLKNIYKNFGTKPIIKDFNLTAHSGEFIVLVGPSGCGKSTLLRMIAGLEDITRGTISVDDTSINNVDPAAREIAMVFQSYALYPHMSALENMSFSLRMEKKLSKSKIISRVREAANILRLEHVLKQKPKELSGGQKQRVAIGRAIVRKPKIFLFDEPLSNLDAELRVEMRLEIAKLREAVHATMIYVTHDQVEAMTLADRIVVLREGVIEQVGTPSKLYLQPNNQFVAGFIGSPKMNFIPATLGKAVSTPTGATHTVTLKNDKASTTFSLPVTNERLQELNLTPEHLKSLENKTVTLGFRPEIITSKKHSSDSLLTNDDATLTFTTPIDVIEYLGNISYLYVQNLFDVSKTDAHNNLIVRTDNQEQFSKHATVALNIPKKELHLFAMDGKALR